MTVQKGRLGLALVLLTASVVALYPTMTLEKTQHGSAVVSIKASGQAFQNSKGKASSIFSSAALTLHGSVDIKSNGGLELDNLAGSLQIGIANYTIARGNGEVNKKGTIEINAKTSDAGKTLELILHGSTQGDNVTFDAKQSKLSSLYFLSLKGQAIVTMPTTSTTTTENHTEHHHNRYGNGTVTVIQNDTVTETITQIQNNTLTFTETSTTTSTEPSNQTVTETTTETMTEPATQTVTEPSSASTVTVTETLTSTAENITTTVTVLSTNATLTGTQI